ncbi:MAG: hypothetical protein WD069_03825 [Planctomycetales bacterium]
MHRKSLPFVLALLLACGFAAPSPAADLDEFRIKREQVFEFARPPAVTRHGDDFTISFESKGLCDVTVVIEDARGEIVRHLASGVLGDNAPPPFAKDSRAQSIVWDSKDDAGRYVDTADQCRVRVSLGLKPQYEKSHFWSPHKRISNIAPIVSAAPEGVYVFEGQGVDHLRLFDHEGEYVRTIHPFPADKIDEVIGLQRHIFPQDGQSLPLKIGYTQATLLSSGSSGAPPDTEGHMGGYGASAMAVHDGKIALAFHSLNRLASDGSSGGLPIQGPKTSFEVENRRFARSTPRVVGPTSICFSPDGKWLYLTGFIWKSDFWVTDGDCFHCVMRMEYAKQDEPQLFLGEFKSGDEGHGSDDKRFCVPTSVACDNAGRVYVSDYVNARIQVFSPDGEYLKTVPTPHPVKVMLDEKTQEIWSFSAGAIGPTRKMLTDRKIDLREMPATVTKLGTFDQPAKPDPKPLPVGYSDGSGGWSETGGQTYQIALDGHAAEPTLWVVGRKPTVSVAELNWSGADAERSRSGWEERGVRLVRRRDDKWELVRDFGQDAKKAVGRVTPPDFSRQRLYVNPRNHKLYVVEDMTGFGKSFMELVEVDPETGQLAFVPVPFDAEDIAFDLEGLAYLRTDTLVMRFDPERNWAEVPWDYGEERDSVGFISSRGGARTNAVSALPTPGERPVWWHEVGMAVSARGHLAVVCNIRATAAERNPKDKYLAPQIGKPYTPHQYPGRAGTRVIHVWDRHGKLIHEDAVPGLPGGDGLGIDERDGLYVMVAAPRVIDGKPYFNGKSETLMKFLPGKARFISDTDRAPVVLGKEQKPDRHPDVTKYGLGPTWAEGAEWKYGGVGYGGQGGSCVCWHARFQLDHLGRSFVPELLRFNVAVLDSAGNLIVRVGRYGNADSAGPDSLVPLGGDGVGLFHPAYVGVDTDRRLFIHDGGNARIVAVKLGYHASETVKLALDRAE